VGLRSELGVRADGLTLVFGIVGFVAVALDSLGDDGYSTWSSAPLYVYAALALFLAAAVHPVIGRRGRSLVTPPVQLALSGLALSATLVIVVTRVGSVFGGVVALLAGCGLVAGAWSSLSQKGGRTVSA
jgi:hypothetical protein